MKTKTSLRAGLTVALLFAAAWTATAIDFSVPDIPQQLTDAQKEANKTASQTPTATPALAPGTRGWATETNKPAAPVVLRAQPESNASTTSNQPDSFQSHYTNQGTASNTSTSSTNYTSTTSGKNHPNWHNKKQKNKWSDTSSHVQNRYSVDFGPTQSTSGDTSSFVGNGSHGSGGKINHADNSSSTDTQKKSPGWLYLDLNKPKTNSSSTNSFVGNGSHGSGGKINQTEDQSSTNDHHKKWQQQKNKHHHGNPEDEN